MGPVLWVALAVAHYEKIMGYQAITHEKAVAWALRFNKRCGINGQRFTTKGHRAATSQ